MCKRPVPGRAKTRLQPRLTAEQASDLYAALVADTIAALDHHPSYELVLAIDRADSAPYFDRVAPHLRQVVQRGPDLGARLDHVLGALLADGHPLVAAVGSDSPLIDGNDVVEAFQLLTQGRADTVFGPTADGGYYLIATDRAPGPLVTDVTMSTPTVLADTRVVAERAGRRIAVVRSGLDVDEPDDLDRLTVELGDRPPSAAPRTRAKLRRLGFTVPAAIDGARDGLTPTDHASASPTEESCSTPMVAVVVPALNEEATIAEVVARCGKQPEVDLVVVADNGSTDTTATEAADAGAVVVHEPRRGYGWACAAGVAEAQDRGATVIAFIDGDLSSPPDELGRVLGPVLAAEADLVMGSRVAGTIARGAMPAHQRWGNAFSAWLLRRLYRIEVSDLGPFRAIRTTTLRSLDMAQMTYGWPTEMTVKCATAGVRLVEVPVSWLPRAGGRSKVSGTVRGSLLAARFIVGVTIRHSRPVEQVLDRVRPAVSSPKKWVRVLRGVRRR